MSSEFKRVRDYELMVIFHPELSEEDLTSEIGRVEGHITAAGGTITLINREAPWGRRRLAYAIRHDSRDVRDGVYVLYYFSSDSTRLADMEREIKLQDRIMRYLLTQQSAPIMEPEAPEDEGTEEGEAAPAEAPATDAGVPANEAPAAEAETEAPAEDAAPEAAEPASTEATASTDETAAPAESDSATAAETDSAAAAETDSAAADGTN